MDLQSSVKQALNALYHHPDAAVRMEADRWLQDFQRTLDAWQVTCRLSPLWGFLTYQRCFSSPFRIWISIGL
uniref:Transportin-3 n=1 Tax=Cannabis sativa TaxID=3483 RepID=A0A803R8I3_CANSA